MREHASLGLRSNISVSPGFVVSGLAPLPAGGVLARAAYPMTATGRPLIAVVDDDESVRRAVRRLLRSIGMDADPFASGDELLQLLSAMPSYHPDCVIIDVQMPGLNGLEVQRRLAGKLPIIFITAHDDLGIREQALGAGAVAFLRKPFNDDLFVKTVDAALASRRARESENR